MSGAPEIRIRKANDADVGGDGKYVLYWMTAARRTRWNFGLQRAAAWASDLKQPLLVWEALRCGYPWASQRFHQFVIQGMADNAQRLRQAGIAYYPYLEPEAGAGQGLLQALAQRASVVVGDEYPCFFLPRMMQAAARQIPVRFELIDSNGLLPLRAADKVYARAHDFRRFLQKNLRPHLEEFPQADPLASLRLPKCGRLPEQVRLRWPPADVQRLALRPGHLASLPIDRRVGVVATAGGAQAAERTLKNFLRVRLQRYDEDRNQPEREATSGLSPYLHFGHVSAHQVFHDVMRHDHWTPDRMAEKATGSSRGWWGARAPVESFLDELITWRELGYNLCWRREDYGQYDSLPDWAQRTLADHAADRRPHVYELPQFEAAQTHDPLWNAAQRQLVREGRIHNYLRMLWGKKILEWSASPEAALQVMIELNNKYALDGRDPNSYSGIFWVLGRYDRAWGPERPIFGKIRYMSSENTARKVRVGQYLIKYAPLP